MSMYRSFKSVRPCLMWIDIFCISRWESQWNGKLLYRFSEELQIDQSSSVGTPGSWVHICIAPDQLCDGWPESELYQQSIENIGKTAALSHLGTQQQTLEHEDEEDDTSTTSLQSGARNISTSHTFTPITFCNCKLVCCKYKWKNINGTLNLLLQFLKITFSQFPGPRLLAGAWCWWCVTPRPVSCCLVLKHGT